MSAQAKTLEPTAFTLGAVSFASAVTEAGRHPEQHRTIRGHLIDIGGRRRWLYEIEPLGVAL